MRKYIRLALIVLVSTLFVFQAHAQKKDNCVFFDTVVNSHSQIFPFSGIPSAIEMALKQCKAVDLNFYKLQNDWQNKTDGSFSDFDKKKLYGVTFYQKFKLPRDVNFPLDSLFQTIDKELKLGRKVIIALQLENGWPIFVVHKRMPNGEFVSYSKFGNNTLIVRNTKEIVKKSNGTEIMTYSTGQ
ncbi:hypothetical protein ACTJKC_02115 [Pedobacter sp. 22226]|uniref:hypothetical protein n=1 Tax=Pedobacter sp. 22226 TaxID=3453894 RepID=UPI003F85E61A